MRKLYLALFLLLLLVLGWLLFQPVKPPPVAVDHQKKPVLRASEELLNAMDYVLGFAPAEIYPEIVERPLFFKERMPPKPWEPDTDREKPAVRPRGSGQPPRLSLKGIIRVGEETFAFARLPGDKTSRRLKVGDDLEGWKVTKILPDRMVLANGNAREEVVLWEYQPVLPPKAPPRQKKRPRNGNRKAAVKPSRAVPPRRQKAVPRNLANP